MKEEFIKYLESIGLTETLCKRIETIYEFYKDVCPDEIADIFVTDYITEDGSREYENLWFFSEKYAMEAKQFITKDDFDITPIKNRIHYCRIQKWDYDFKKATEKSRLYLRCDQDTGMSCEFKASKENCDYLKDIILNYILPNLKNELMPYLMGEVGEKPVKKARPAVKKRVARAKAEEEKAKVVEIPDEELVRFYDEKRPKSQIATVTVFAYYLKHFKGKEEFGSKEVKGLYEALRLPVPKKYSQAIWDASSKRGFVTKTEKKGLYRITEAGERFVEEGLPKK